MTTTFNELIAAEKPLVLPVAHDALSARLIEMAGFRAYSVGGFPAVGARLAYPDLGLVGFAEMRDAVRDIMTGSGLPLMLDCDDGYGDAKNVARTVRTYEAMGVAGMLIEDQTSPKRCGHMAGKDVVPAEVWLGKLRAALAARRSPDTFILARTDARAVHGLDEALRRGEAAVALGVDGLFVEAPQSLAELETIGRSFDLPLVANMLEDGRTPLLAPAELAAMGFAIVVYPVSLVFRVARTIEKALADMKAGTLSLADEGVGFEDFKRITRFADWAGIEKAAEAD